MSDGWESNVTPLSEAKKKRHEGDRVEVPPPDVDDCPVQPLGTRGHDFYYFRPNGELIALSGLAHRRAGIRMLFCGDLRWCERHFPHFDGRRPKPGTWSEDQVADWLQQECTRKGIFDPAAPSRGVGTWRVDSHHLVVHCGNALVLPQNDELKPAGQKIGGVLYPAAPPIARPAAVPADTDAGEKILKAFGLWNLRDPMAPGLLLGFVASAMLGGAPDWRPHVLVKATHGSGKTWLAEFVAALLGAAAHPMNNNYTEPGLRQALTSEARTLILDEAEESGADSRVRAVVQMLRHMSGGAGARTVRGTQGGRSLSYTVTGCAYMSAILPPVLEPQDRSRILCLDLGPIVADDQAGCRRDAAQRATAWGHEVSASLRARVIGKWGLFVDSIDAYRHALLERGCSMRQADQLGTLLAGRNVMVQDESPIGEVANTEVEAVMHLVDAIKEDEKEGEGEQCLAHLYGSPAEHWRAGDRRTVGELILTIVEGKHDAHDNTKALGRLGLRVVPPSKDKETGVENGGFRLLVANSHVGVKRLFAGTRWEAGSWSTALGYLDGAKPGKGSTHFAGAGSRYVELPASWLPQEEPVVSLQQGDKDNDDLADDKI